MLSNGTYSRDLSQNITCTHLTAWPRLPFRERFSKDLSLDITGLGIQEDQFLEWEVCESLELIDLDIQEEEGKPDDILNFDKISDWVRVIVPGGWGIGGITRKEVHSLLDVVCGLIFTHRPIEIRASNIWRGPPLNIEADFEVKFYPD